MKILKSLRRRRARPANPEKVIRGFVRALGNLKPQKAPSGVQTVRSKT